MLDYYKDIYLELESELEFGKHQGRSIKDILDDDPDYIRWMFSEGFDLGDDVYYELDV
jgi:uncharacterized protein (DUF3820 family)